MLGIVSLKYALQIVVSHSFWISFCGSIFDRICKYFLLFFCCVCQFSYWVIYFSKYISWRTTSSSVFLAFIGHCIQVPWKDYKAKDCIGLKCVTTPHILNRWNSFSSWHDSWTARHVICSLCVRARACMWERERTPFRYLSEVFCQYLRNVVALCL
jgi:hypothetical protein